LHELDSSRRKEQSHDSPPKGVRTTDSGNVEQALGRSLGPRRLPSGSLMPGVKHCIVGVVLVEDHHLDTSCAVFGGCASDAWDPRRRSRPVGGCNQT
jgi:hypothetical protein